MKGWFKGLPPEHSVKSTGTVWSWDSGSDLLSNVVGTGAMFVGAQKKLPKKERGRKEKGEDYIISHLIKSSH